MSVGSPSFSCSSVSTLSKPPVLAPKIDLTNISFPGNLPIEVWEKIFSYLGFKELKLFIEQKVKVLNFPLNGEEDNHRLMMGKKFIFHKKDFLEVVENVYKIALCCKTFYFVTLRERRLLINAAEWARYDERFFIDQMPIRNSPSICQMPPKWPKLPELVGIENLREMLREPDPIDFRHKYADLFLEPRSKTSLFDVSAEKMKVLADLRAENILISTESMKIKLTEIDFFGSNENFIEKIEPMDGEIQSNSEEKEQTPNTDGNAAVCIIL